MFTICQKLFSSFNDAEIKYCHWKSNEHLGAGLDGKTDLDIYVFPDDKFIATSILSKLQFVKFCSQKAGRYDGVEDWIGFDYCSGGLVHIHLHFCIITGTKFCKEYLFPIEGLVLERRILDQETGVYIIDPELELLILYSRIVLKSQKKHRIRVSKDYSKEILYLKRNITWIGIKELLYSLFSEEDAFIFFEYLKKDSLDYGQWYKLYCIVSNWLCPYKRHNSIYTLFRSKYYWCRHYLLLFLNKKFDKSYINRKTLPRRGVSICFIGQDGCGKSTITQTLCKWLNWKIEAHRFYLGSGDHYHSLLHSFIKHFHHPQSDTIRKKNPIKQNKEFTDTDKIARKRKCGIIRRIKTIVSCIAILNISRNAKTQVKKADRYLKKGAIALYDRFPQVQFAGLYDGPKIESIFGNNSRMIQRLARREYKNLEEVQNYCPDIVIKLILSPEESKRRKPHDNYELIKKKSLITPELKFPNSEVFMIDATQNLEDELLLIKRIIWKRIVEQVL